MKKLEDLFELNYCKKCIQMTNHIGNTCQKCFDPMICTDCGKRLKPIIDTFTGKKSKYEFRCPCWKDGLIMCIG